MSTMFCRRSWAVDVIALMGGVWTQSRHRRMKGRGSRWSAATAPSHRLLDDEARFEGHRPGHIVKVGRGRHHRLVDLGELLLGAATLDADDVP